MYSYLDEICQDLFGMDFDEAIQDDRGCYIDGNWMSVKVVARALQEAYNHG